MTLTTRSNALFTRPVGAGEHRRAQLEERHALAGHVLAALDQQLGRLRREPHLHARAVRRLDDLEHGLLVEVALVQDHLVRPRPARAALASGPSPPGRRTSRRTRTRARRRDAVSTRSSESRARRPRRRAGRGARTCSSRCSSSVNESYAARRSPIASAARDARGRDQARGGEVVVRAPAERERDRGDEHDRRGDLPEPGAPLASGVEARLPEDEPGDRHQERQPLRRACLPEQVPEDRVAEDDVAEDERRVEAEREPERVEPGEHHDRRARA